MNKTEPAKKPRPQLQKKHGFSEDDKDNPLSQRKPSAAYLAALDAVAEMPKKKN